ncbi:MAG: tetratricopeptide repeat protein [Bacteroidota bacterium]
MKQKYILSILSGLFCIPVFSQHSSPDDSLSIHNLSDNPQAIQLFMKAEKFFEKEKYTKAAKYYAEAYRVDTTITDALDNAGVSYRRAYEMDSAIYYYKKSLVKNAGNTNILLNLSLVYIYEEMYTDAIETLNTLLDLYPDDASALYHLGLVYSFTGQYERAIHYGDLAFTQWLPINSDKAQQSALLVCESFISLNNKDSAAAYYKKAQEKGMKPADSFKDLGL